MPSPREKGRRTRAARSRSTMSTPPIVTAPSRRSKSSWRRPGFVSPFCCKRIYNENQTVVPLLGLPLFRLARPDQKHCDVDGIVVGPRKEIDGAQHRVMEAVAQIGDFRDPYRRPSEICGTLIEKP